MKTRTFLLLATVTPLLWSCGKLIHFNINYSTDVTIPASIGISVPVDLTSAPITSDLAGQSSSNNTSPDLIQSIKVKSMKATITNYPDSSFNFLENVEIYIDTDTKEPTLIAYKNAIPNSIGNELVFDVTGAEIKPYLTESTYTLITRVTKDGITTVDYDVDIDVVFDAGANLLGL